MQCPLQNSHIKFRKEVRISDCLSCLLMDFFLLRLKLSIRLSGWHKHFLSNEPQQMMSLVCHYHIVKPHLINKGFEAELIVVFKIEICQLSTLLICIYSQIYTTKQLKLLVFLA